MTDTPQTPTWPDARGRYGEFGGRYVSETLMGPLTELQEAFEAIVDDEAFQDAVNALASKLASMPTRGLGLTKKALHAAMNHDLHAQLKLELDLQFEAAETSDYAEGVQAFLEKRKPQFTGT